MLNEDKDNLEQEMEAAAETQGGSSGETESKAPDTGDEEAASGEAAEADEAGEADAENEEASAKEESDGSDKEPASDEGKEEAAEPAEDEKGGKKLSRRDKKALAKKDEEIASLTDQWRRTMAEFDNYRKRTEKEKAAMYGMGVKDVIEKILPVVDNFERGFSQVTEEDKDDAFVHGMEAIYKQFMTVLDGLGVKPIEAVGQTFDPAFHNAVMHVDDETVGENIIVEEFQKGYMYQDTVVRFSMVKVAN